MRFDPEKLKEARKAADLSQEHIAVAAGCTARTVQNWEAGTSVPTSSQLGTIAELLGRTTDYFYAVEAAS